MRPPLLRPIPSTLPKRLILSLCKPYSTSTTTPQPPLIKVRNITVPSTGRIRILTLARPSARNAISQDLLSELRRHIIAIAAEYDGDGNEVEPSKRKFGAMEKDETGPTRALILASEVESCFCAGADLKERRGMSVDETAEFLVKLRETFTLLWFLPIPSISAISSLALGGGLELALCTHFRVLASTASVGLPETRLGIIPGAGGTYRLPQLIGQVRARDLILTGRRVSAAEAYFMGIADRLVKIEPGEGEMKRGMEGALKEAIDMAAEICQGGPVAVRAALEAVAYANDEVENKQYARVFVTDDRNEALKAFAEKRKPKFTGK